MPGKKRKQRPRAAGAGLVPVDPSRVYFTHSRIRPVFSGCGRAITDTVASLEAGDITVDDLPAITVIASQPDGSPPYFSLNNRRLYTFKTARTRGLLAARDPPNTVLARVRPPGDSKRLREKYSIQRCSLSAKLMREGGGGQGSADSGAATPAQGAGLERVAPGASAVAHPSAALDQPAPTGESGVERGPGGGGDAASSSSSESSDEARVATGGGFGALMDLSSDSEDSSDVAR